MNELVVSARVVCGERLVAARLVGQVHDEEHLYVLVHSVAKKLATRTMYKAQGYYNLSGEPPLAANGGALDFFLANRMECVVTVAQPASGRTVNLSSDVSNFDEDLASLFSE